MVGQVAVAGWHAEGLNFVLHLEIQRIGQGMVGFPLRQILVAQLRGPSVNRVALRLRTCLLRRVGQSRTLDDQRAFGSKKPDELALVAHRAKTLVVEVIGHAVLGHFFQGGLDGRDLLRLQCAQCQMEPIGPDVMGCIRDGDLAEVFHVNVMMRQPSARAAEDRQVLHLQGVAIFQAAVGEAVGLDLPTTAHRSQGVRSGPAALFHAIERERAVAGRHNVGQFLDLKVFGLLFELHGMHGRKKRDRETWNSKPSPSQLRIPDCLSISSMMRSSFRQPQRQM